MKYFFQDNTFEKHTIVELLKKLNNMYSFNYKLTDNTLDCNLFLEKLDTFDNIKRAQIIKMTLHTLDYLDNDYDFFINLLELLL